MKTRVPGAADDREGHDPEILALLDFEPVPRQREVEGGWTPERQREFISRLAVHGSATRACDEMGKNQSGIMKLYRSPLGASFRAAWDAAVALAKRRRAEREAALAPVSPDMKPPTVDHRWKHGRFARSSPVGPEARSLSGGQASTGGMEEEPGSLEDEAEKEAWLADILTKYWCKVVAERKARLNGEIVAADFYLRQLTWLEVALDVASGGKGLEQMDRLRHDGHHLIDIAETMMSRLLDDVRREAWREMGEPERPERPPRHLLVEHQGPLGSYSGFINNNHAKELDCSADFFNRFEMFTDQIGSVKFHIPFRNSSKADVVREAVRLGVPIGTTFSCQAYSDTPCGACPNCVERLSAVREVRNHV